MVGLKNGQWVLKTSVGIWRCIQVVEGGWLTVGDDMFEFGVKLENMQKKLKMSKKESNKA